MVASLGGGGDGGMGVLQLKSHFLGTTSMFMSAAWNLHTKLPQQAKQPGKGNGLIKTYVYYNCRIPL
jgi:hypothetical protein